jgi:UPF0755 protein
LRLLVFVTALAFIAAAGWLVYNRVLGLEGSDLSDLDSAARKAYLNTHRAELDQPAGEDRTMVAFVVEPGETGRGVAERLYELGLIKDRRLFRSYLSEEGLTIETGEYSLNETMSPRQIIEALQHGFASEIVLTIPEGRRLQEIADLAAGIGIDRAEFMALATAQASGTPGDTGEFGYDFLGDRPAGATLEGYLFPDTYRLPENVGARELIERMLGNFAARVSLGDAGRSLYDVVVLASIVEREAVLAEERSTIASVYLNRLDNGIKLDADPTIQYALGQPGDWWPQITVDHYTSVDSPWNTYLYAGLPPSPISNPGLAAIQAVLNPAETDYLFFMRDCDADDGSHLFATNSEQHMTNYNHCFGQ